MITAEIPAAKASDSVIETVVHVYTRLAFEATHLLKDIVHHSCDFILGRTRYHLHNVVFVSGGIDDMVCAGAPIIVMRCHSRRDMRPRVRKRPTISKYILLFSPCLRSSRSSRIGRFTCSAARSCSAYAAYSMAIRSLSSSSLASIFLRTANVSNSFFDETILAPLQLSFSNEL